MKVFFTLTETQLSTAAIEVGSQQFKLEHLLPLQNQKSVLARLTGSNIGVWIDMPFEITRVGYFDDSGNFNPLNMVVISKGRSYVKSIIPVTVTRFEKGKTYLLPFREGAVTDIFPQHVASPIDNTTDGIYSSSHYLYIATDTHVPIYDNQVNDCYIVDYDYIGAGVEQTKPSRLSRMMADEILIDIKSNGNNNLN